MTFRTLFITLLTLLLTLGCTQESTSPQDTSEPEQTASAEPEGFQLQLIGGDNPGFEPTHVRIDLRRDTKRSAIILANYDFELKPKTANSLAPVDQEGQTRIHITIGGNEGATFENPLPVGEYQAETTSIDEYTFADGEQKRKNVDNEEGLIVITEVTDSHIRGNLDVTGEDNFRLKGDFQAEIVN